jgi:hypothetical protein
MKSPVVWYPEFLKAIIRILNRYQARTLRSRSRAWLRLALDIANADLAKLSEGDWINMQYEVAAFCDWLTVQSIMDDDIDMIEDELMVIEKVKAEGRLVDESEEEDFPRLPAREDIQNLQAVFRTNLNHLLFTPHEDPRIPIHLGISINMEVNISKSSKGRVVCSQNPSAEKSWENLGLFILTFFLGRNANMIHKCEECTKMYLADRKDQLYCNVRCRNRATQRRFREKTVNKSVSSRKHKRHKKGEKHGKKAR